MTLIRHRTNEKDNKTTVIRTSWKAPQAAETIEMLQRELDALKKENLLLKNKIIEREGKG